MAACCLARWLVQTRLGWMSVSQRVIETAGTVPSPRQAHICYDAVRVRRDLMAEVSLELPLELSQGSLSEKVEARPDALAARTT